MPLFLKTSRYPPNQPFFLHAFHLECSRLRERPAVESKSMLRLVVTKLMVPACGRCCWEHTTKGAEGATLAKGCARDRGGGELRRCRGCAHADCMRSRNLSKYSKKTRKSIAREQNKMVGDLREIQGYVIYKISRW